jgi:uncharacterized protein YdeI (YjbR/CyaY-like superfamily)
MVITNPLVDKYIQNTPEWQKQLERLRRILLACSLTEDVKWGVPCYTSRNRNIVLIHVFKDYCALLFFKGALLKDSHGVLVQQTRNTQAARQLRFTTVRDIATLEPVIKAYVREAIAVEEAGLSVSYKKTGDFNIPAEFQEKLAELPALRAAFEGLTPGRQRAYLLYFAAPKQSKTRAARIEKYLEQILEGRGLHD